MFKRINLYIIGPALVSIIIIGWWLSSNPTSDFIESKPGMDNKGEGFVAEKEAILIGEFYERYESNATGFNEKWPRFRGAYFDNTYRSSIKLINSFDTTKSPYTWSVDLGEGHSGAAIYNGLVYVLDYDEKNKADMLRCFTLDKGIEQWRRWYKVYVKRNHGMSRTVPAVTDKYILTIGPRCHVMCVNRKNGDFLWGIDIEKDYESEVPLWYTGQCPLIDNDIAILATGGKKLLIGVDCATGEILWETPNEKNWLMSHSSIMPYTFNGQKMYVYAAVGGICGISAEKDNMGEILWETSAWNHSVVAPSPVCLPDGKIFITAGYGAGSMVLQLSYADGTYSIEVIDEYKPNMGLACEQQTPVYFNGHLFGILPKDAAALRNQFVCVHPANFKQMVWTSGKENRFGLGPYIIADDKFYLLKDDGTLFIIKASEKEFKLLDKRQILKGHDAWAPLAIADGYMVLRDSKKMVCIDLNI